MNRQLFITSAVLTTLVGCAATPEPVASLEGDPTQTLPATAAGMTSEPLYFDSSEDAAKALTGYNYALTILSDGRVQAFVSGINGSGADNPFTAGQITSQQSASKPLNLAQSEGEQSFPSIALKEKYNGQQAIDALGDKLGSVAKAYDMSAERLEEILRTDSTAWIDESGRLLYIDSLPKIPKDEVQESTDPVIGSASAATKATTTEPFALHSKPGSNRVIYLDFTGHDAVNTAWYAGTLNGPVYDIDNNPGSFSTTELNNIKLIWQRVAEDYAPFDVDVTTQEPAPDALKRTSSTDSQYGVRAVITRSTPVLCNQACGGIAYMNVFSYFSATNPERYQPAWVFFDKLGNGNPKYVAEAVSHEVGHNLNLNHDGNASTGYYSGHGSGATGWAPIMGVGYYKPVSQWSKGEYPGANSLQDDIAVIHSAGTPLRVDDYPNTTASAAPLGGLASAIAQTGIIERNTDVDVFNFTTGGGNAQFTVTPDAIGANLDVLLKVIDANGNVVAQSNPVDSLSASLSLTLNAGQYFLHIEGVGKGDLLTGYSDYGSVGQYQITGSYPQVIALQAPTAVIVALPTSGDAPLTVSLNANSSSDRDGSIAAYEWKFGDGTTSSNAKASHIYTTPGSYSSILTVTDNNGLKNSTSQSIQVNQSPVPVGLKVDSVAITRTNTSSSKFRCEANIIVKYGNSVMKGAAVYGYWGGSASSNGKQIKMTGSTSGMTSSTGKVSLKSTSLPNLSSGTCGFTVTKVIKSRYAYDGSGDLSGSFTW